MIKPIYWQDGAVIILDQRALPHEERYLTLRTYGEVIAAIENLSVRGAPALGVAAALGIALGARNLALSSREEFKEVCLRIADEFAATRPTARNLFWAVERMKSILNTSTAPLEEMKMALQEEALRILREDIEINMSLGEVGKVLIGDGFRLLTHCNAGALATAGYGTALGVIRSAWREGKRILVYVDETRPVLQGARLTAWELQREGIPFYVITDNMAGFFIARGEIDCILVGADRIAANGDVANKIGTYILAILARERGIPFYVAAPLTTFDPSLKDGRSIPIEERDEREVLQMGGINLAPEGAKAKNPAFDVTPHHLISAIITERGILRPPFSEAIARLFQN